MAIFIATTQSISRADGRSAVAAACYRAGDKAYDERYDKVHDYTKRSGVMNADIVLPKSLEGSGVEVSRGKLWNLAESAENRKNSRVAREWLVNLPHELTDEARHELALEFAKALADKFGVIADCAIHKPTKREIAKGGDPRNYHAHIMLTTRQAELDANGALCFGRKADCELSDTDRKKLGLCKAKEEIMEIRQLYEELVNNKLVENGLGHKKVDCRSYKDQGLDIIPQVKVGAKSTQLERRGVATLEGDTNRLISERNKRVRKKTLALLRRKKRIQQLPRNINIKMRYQRQRQEKIDHDAIRDGIERADRAIAQFNEFLKIRTDAARQEQRGIDEANQFIEISEQQIDEYYREFDDRVSGAKRIIEERDERRSESDDRARTANRGIECRKFNIERLIEHVAHKKQQLAERLIGRHFFAKNPYAAQRVPNDHPTKFSQRQIKILDTLAEFMNENEVSTEPYAQKIARLAKQIDDKLLAQHPDALTILLNCHDDELQYQNAKTHWQSFIANLDAACERTLKNNAYKFPKNSMLNQLTISENILERLVDYSKHSDTPKLSQTYANQRLQQELATTCQNYQQLCQQHDLSQKLTEPHRESLNTLLDKLMNKFGEYLNPKQTAMLAAAHKTLEVNAKSPEPLSISNGPNSLDLGF